MTQKYNDKKHCFEFPLLPGVVKHLKEIVPKLVLEEQLETYIAKKNSAMLFLNKNRDSKNISDTISDVGLKTVSLFPHQRVSSKINECFERILCLDEMGLSKTLVAIRTALFRMVQNNNQRCLIICSNSIKNSVWAKEISGRTHMGFCVPFGPKDKREKMIENFLNFNQQNSGYYFLIINYEMTFKYTALLKKFVDGQMLIIDEAQYMKTPSSQRTKAIFKLDPKYVLSMTGTPLDNKVEDIYTLSEYVCPLIFGGSVRRFEDRYCVKDDLYIRGPNGNRIKRKVICGYKNINELKAKLALISYRRRKKDVLDLPPKTYENRLVNMSTEQWKYYEEMRKDCYVLIKDADSNEIESIANGILAKMLRLSQITGGYVTDFADKDNAYWMKNSGKLSELDEIVDQVVRYAGDKIVIWSRFVEVVRSLKARYSKWNAVAIHGDVSEENRAQIVEDFQTDNKTMIFIGQVQSCGVGMTLHRASVEVFYDKCFLSSAVISQAEDRLHRIGMGDRCTVISLISKGTN